MSSPGALFSYSCFSESILLPCHCQAAWLRAAVTPVVGTAPWDAQELLLCNSPQTGWGVPVTSEQILSPGTSDKCSYTLTPCKCLSAISSEQPQVLHRKPRTVTAKLGGGPEQLHWLLPHLSLPSGRSSSPARSEPGSGKGDGAKKGSHVTWKW